MLLHVLQVCGHVKFADSLLSGKQTFAGGHGQQHNRSQHDGRGAVCVFCLLDF